MRGADQLPKLRPSSFHNRPGIGKKLSDNPKNNSIPPLPNRANSDAFRNHLADLLSFNDESLFDTTPADNLKLTDQHLARLTGQDVVDTLVNDLPLFEDVELETDISECLKAVVKTAIRTGLTSLCKRVVFDGGCTKTICGDKTFFLHLTPLKQPVMIRMGKGHTFATHLGLVEWNILVGSTHVHTVSETALYCPSFTGGLTIVSAPMWAKYGLENQNNKYIFPSRGRAPHSDPNFATIPSEEHPSSVPLQSSESGLAVLEVIPTSALDQHNLASRTDMLSGGPYRLRSDDLVSKFRKWPSVSAASYISAFSTMCAGALSTPEHTTPSFTVTDLFHGGVNTSANSLEPLGFKITQGCDNDPKRRSSFVEKTSAVSYPTIEEMLETQSVADTDCWIVSPPCVRYSISTEAPPGKDRRSTLWLQLLRQRRHKPKTIIFENVPNFVNFPEYQQVLDTLEQLGYHTNSQFLDSRDFGSCGTRLRLVILATRTDVAKAVGPLSVPQPTPGTPPLLSSVLWPLDAKLSDIVMTPEQLAASPSYVPNDVSYTPGWTGPRKAYIPAEGDNVKWQSRIFQPICAVPQRGGKGVNPTGLYLHHRHVVRLNLLESASVQGIPLRQVVRLLDTCSTDEVQTMIGDSISGHLMSALGRSVHQTLSDFAALSSLHRAVNLNLDVPHQTDHSAADEHERMRTQVLRGQRDATPQDHFHPADNDLVEPTLSPVVTRSTAPESMADLPNKPPISAAHATDQGHRKDNSADKVIRQYPLDPEYIKTASRKRGRQHWPRMMTQDDPNFLPKVNEVFRWHVILGHIGRNALEELIEISDIPLTPGDSRYMIQCKQCLEDKMGRFGAAHKSLTRHAGREFQVGECWSYDAQEFGVCSHFSNASYVLNFVELHSRFTIAFYVPNLKEPSIVAALEYLRRFVACTTRQQLTMVYTDLASYNVDYPVVTQWRAKFGVGMECPPPYMHWLNHIVEQKNDVLKRGMRTCLQQLVGKTICGKLVTRENCWQYWDIAHHHNICLLWNRPERSLQQKLGFPAAPAQVYFQSPVPIQIDGKHRAFGETCYRYVDIQNRSNIAAAAEACTYLFPASFCPFLDKIVEIPKGHVVINSKGNLVVSGQLRFMDSSRRMVLVPPDVISRSKEILAQPIPTQQGPMPIPLDDPAQSDGDMPSSQPPQNPAADDATVDQSAYDRLETDQHDPYTISKVNMRTKLSLGIQVHPTRHKQIGSTSQARFVKYRPATTLGGFLRLGGTMADFFNDLERGLVRFTDPRWQRRANEMYAESWKAPDAAVAGGGVPTRPAPPTAPTRTPSRPATIPTPSPPPRRPPPSPEPPRPPPTPVPTPVPAPVVDHHPVASPAARAPDQPQPRQPPPPAPAPVVPERRTSTRTRVTTQQYKPSATDARWKRTIAARQLAQQRQKEESERLSFHEHALAKIHPGVEQVLLSEETDLHDMLAWAKLNLIGSSLDPIGTDLFLQSLDNAQAKPREHVLPHVHDPWHEDFADAFTMRECSEILLTLVPETAHAATSDPPIPDKVPKGSPVSPDDVSLAEDYIFELKSITDPEERRLAALSILKEIRDLCSIGTFELVDRTPDTKELSSRLVLKVKYKADGTYDKHKGRLVVRGFEARPGFDFLSTFSPMASIVAVRLLMSVAVHHGWNIIHSDIPQAFCQSPIDTEICIKLPKGITVRGQSDSKVLRLLRALYGLKQSPQLWNKHLNHQLLQLGFVRAHGDTCIYHFHEGDKCLFVATEVDDLVITGNHTAKLKELKSSLEDSYLSTTTKSELDWDDPISSFLGIDINYDQDAGTLTMGCEAKVDALETKFPWLSQCGFKDTPSMAAEDHTIPSQRGSESVKALGRAPNSNVTDYPLFDPTTQEPTETYLTSLDRSYFLAEQDYTKREPKGELLAKLKLNYRSVVGSLIYMMTSCRPDLCFAVGKLSRHMHAPEDLHAIWLKRTIAYLRQTKGFTLNFSRDASPAAHAFDMANKGRTPFEIISGFTDANFANSREAERKSLTGFCFFAYGNLIMWKSKVQPLTACSTHEAELIALTFASQEAVWFKRLLLEIGLILNSPIPIMCDNQGTVFTAHNPNQNQRSKHLDIRYFKVRQYIEEKLVNVLFVPTKLNLADFFTKSLNTQSFTRFRDIIMGTQVHCNLTVAQQSLFLTFQESIDVSNELL